MPSLVEDAVAIGAAKQVVGVSHFTSDIPEVAKIERVGDFSSISLEQIVKLHPDVIVGIPSQAALLAPLQRLHYRIVLVPDDAYDDIFTDIQALGRITGHEFRATALVRSLKIQTARLSHEASARRYHPRVFVALGTGPIWTAGPRSYIAKLIALAGGTDAVTTLPSAYAQFSSEALLALQPDIIITDPAVQLSAVLRREPWRSLKAVQRGRIYTVDPPAILQRPGPRYIRGLQWLIDHLQQSHK